MHADPVKAKVHKNLHRYAEDSLDARIREVQQNAAEGRFADSTLLLSSQKSGQLQRSGRLQESQGQSELSSFHPSLAQNQKASLLSS